MIPYKPQVLSDEATQINVTQEKPVMEGLKMMAQLVLSVAVFLWVTQLVFEYGAPVIPQTWESQLAHLYRFPEKKTSTAGLASPD